MILFSLLNRVFDLGSEVAIAQNFGIPSTYCEIFVLMRKNELIENDLAHRMIGLVTFRNKDHMHTRKKVRTFTNYRCTTKNIYFSTPMVIVVCCLMSIGNT